MNYQNMSSQRQIRFGEIIRSIISDALSKDVNAKLNAKFTPKIKFFLDDTFEEAERINKLLSNKRVLRDLK